MFSLRNWFVVSLLLMIFGRFNSDEINNDNLAVRVYTALDEVLKFICDNMSDMNVDGMFGVVMASDRCFWDLVKVSHFEFDANFQHKVALYKTKSYFSAHLRSIPPEKSGPQFDHLVNLTSYIIHTFKRNHTNASSRNEIFMRYLLNVELWMRNINFVYGTLDSRSGVDFLTCAQYLESLANMHFSEELSDDCLSEVIQGSVLDKRLCKVSSPCVEFVDSNIVLPGYGITHQLLLVQSIRALKCDWNLAWIQKRIENFCSRIYRESTKIQNCGYIPALDDLFMEEVVLCGFEGFAEFLSREWMEHILRVKSSYGCYGTFTSASVFEKREANLIKHNCIDHTTGLGAAALSLFLRFLIETGNGGRFLVAARNTDYNNNNNNIVV
ncbi:hypothetical protein FQR65_LT03931 [Abscondita terminalis]|nr:hypothetical protein FQR65_LT03931 [Abscondita terminalis]